MITGEVVNFLWFIGNPYNTWFISNGLGDTTSGRFLAKTQRKAGFQILSLPLSDKRHLKTEWMRTSSQNVKNKTGWPVLIRETVSFSALDYVLCFESLFTHLSYDPPKLGINLKTS